MATYEVEYSETMMPKRVEYYDGDMLTDQTRNMTVEVILQTREQHPQSEFSFAQFDLPEPIGEGMRPPYNWPPILAACVLGLAVVTVLFKLLHNRMRRSSNQT